MYRIDMQPLNSLLQDKGVNRQGSFSPEKQNVLNSELDHSLRYFLVFIFLGGIASIWFSYVMLLFRFSPSTLSLINLGIVGTIFLLVMIFQSVLIRSMQFNFFLVLIEAVALPAFSYNEFTPWQVVATVAFVAVWWLGYSRAQVMINAVVKINFWHYSAMLTSASISALAIFLACFYVGVYQQSGGLSFPAYKLVTSAVGIDYAVPNFNPETDVGVFFESIIKSKVEALPEFQKLSPGDQRSVVQDSTGAILQNFTSLTKTAISPGESILEYTFRVVKEFLNRAEQQNYGYIVIIGIIISIFLFIKGVMFFVKWPVIFISFIIYILLQAIGIITIGAEMRQKEVIVVK